MKINLISLSTVKSQLGITDALKDAAITAMIPIVSADVRRILNAQYIKWYTCAFNISSKYIDLSSYTRNRMYDYITAGEFMLNVGTVLEHPNLVEDTYISAFDPLTGLFELSETPTGTGIYVYPTISISMWPTISKMIQYRLSKQNNKSEGEILSSISYGSVSKSYSQKEINRQYNYPQILIDDLGTPYASVC